MKVLGFAADRADRLAVANYYAYRYNGFDMKFHAHPNAEIMYNDGGACEIFWKENGNNKKLALKKGQFAVLPSQTQHMLYVPQGGRCDILNLELTLSAENGFPARTWREPDWNFWAGACALQKTRQMSAQRSKNSMRNWEAHSSTPEAVYRLRRF